MIVLDCARAKNFRVNGGAILASTPTIDGLAREGTVFSRAVSPANWTLPSHLSIFTGVYPSIHGVQTFRRLDPTFVTTAQRLLGLGYETAMFTENIQLVAGFGVESGFENLNSRWIGVSESDRTSVNRLFHRADFLRSSQFRELVAHVPPLIAPLTMLFHSQEVAHKQAATGAFVERRFAEWLGKRTSTRPFYAFFNLVDTHDPYDLVTKGPQLSLLERAYAFAPHYYMLGVPGMMGRVRWDALLGGYLESIHAADTKVGNLLEILNERGYRDNTWIILTSDHGQSFGEGGNAFHGCGATDSVTRVPLVVAPPRDVNVPRQVDRWISLCELASWVDSIAADRPPNPENGGSPVPWIEAGEAPRVVYCEGSSGSEALRSLRGVQTHQLWNHRLVAAYHGQHKHVLDLETSEVYYWPTSGDPDLIPPLRVAPHEALEIRRLIFPSFERNSGATVRSRTSLLTEPDLEIDERLRSWGYD